ncbi:proprotein convertase P [Variovorax guangxiensis]|uniref:Proprotein convertase P n=1 Tax=Variovorax guangxiensis TaxID=1775474 RepID=A0A433MVJ9_9BURK|nr:calcium-binding protein [Variovorax guangxiensis]RUR71925.1 proprotein convertase P [Variovorax guangxiensis]
MTTFSINDSIFAGLRSAVGVNTAALQRLVDAANQNSELNIAMTRAVTLNDVVIRLAEQDELAASGAGAFFDFMSLRPKDDGKMAIVIDPNWIIGANATLGVLNKTTRANLIDVFAHEFDHYLRADAWKENERLRDLSYRSGELTNEQRFELYMKNQMQLEVQGWYAGLRAFRKEVAGGPYAALGISDMMRVSDVEKRLLEVEDQGRRQGLSGAALDTFVIEKGAAVVSINAKYWERYVGNLSHISGVDTKAVRARLALRLDQPDDVIEWSESGGTGSPLVSVVLYRNGARIEETQNFDLSGQTLRFDAGNHLIERVDVAANPDGTRTAVTEDGFGEARSSQTTQTFDDGSSIVQTVDFANHSLSETTTATDGSVQSSVTTSFGQAANGTESNAFTLTTANTLAAVHEAAHDPNAQTDQVTQGQVASGGSWNLSYNADDLNNNQFVGGAVDNTSAAAITQILADGWRPGNGNTVAPVIDPEGNLLGSGLFNPDPWLIGNWLNTANTLAQFTLPTDPLVLDLDGDGVKLTQYSTAPVLFDADNDGGSLEQTGWVSATDGIVAVDRNGNGKIDNISETLSEYFGGAAGTDGNAGEKRFKDGFAALKSLDSNGDNVFNSTDAAWNSVRVWVDGNHDGKSWDDANRNSVVDSGETSELKTLGELGITQINLANTAQSGEVRDGNEVLARGTFVQNGQTKEAIAANFLANPNGSTSSTSGTGTVVSSQAGSNASATSSYVAGNDAGEIIDVASKGVRNAAGADGNDVLTGDANNNWLAGGLGSDTFNGGAGDDILLIDANDLQQNIHGGAGTDIAQVVGDRGVTLNMSQAEVEVAQGGRGNDIFVAGGRSSVFMRGGDGNDVLIGGSAADALSGEDGDDLIDGGAGNDVLRGHRGEDNLSGGAGDDLLDGGLGDDGLFGGLGNDVLKGGSGDDTIDGGEGVDAIELRGNYSEYRILKTEDGVWISDTVAGRDGTDFVKNVERANFADVNRVEIPSSSSAGLENPLPVKDVLSKDKNGVNFDRANPHLIGKAQLLANDIDWQGDALQISQLFDVTGGTASITAAGDVLFTPDASFTGFMGFKYTVTDSKGNVAATVIDPSTGQSAGMRAAVYLKTPDMPSDPLLTDQWYLADANILPVWKDYTGKGVNIGQFEPSGPFSTTKEVLDYRHGDLKDNIDAQWLANAQPGQLAGEGSEGKLSDHATLVAGVIVGSKNGIGGVGVAYGATVAGHWLSAQDFGTLAKMQQYDVVNHSWGAGTNFDVKFTPPRLGALPAAYENAVSFGREALGTVIVTAGGNDRAKGGDTNYSNVSNTRTSIIVGAINAKTDLGLLQVGGKPFSSPGASILVSAPGSNVSSTSRLVQNSNGSTFGANETVAQGTSFATPIVSGIVALMLEANPALGYRDVQQILAISARKVDDASTTWQTNGSKTWNGGGMHASHDYGYGEVDARAAVRLAETWTTQQTWGNEFYLLQPSASGVLNMAIADGAPNGIRHTLAVNNTSIRVEHVEVRLNITHARPGDLIVKLISPSGTESILMNRPGKAPGSDASDRGDASFNGSSTLDYVFDTALLRGESANGNWTLQVIDTATGDVGTLNSWSMDVYGAAFPAGDDQYVYTNEFAQLAGAAGRNVLNDTNGGQDTINAAAISSASRIDLSAGTATLAGANLTIQNPGVIENLIGGEFNDTLIGNAANNTLIGGRGNDSLSGGDGTDAFFGGLGGDTMTGGNGGDLFVIEKDPGATDVITDFAVEVDKLVVSGFAVDTWSSLQLTAQGADTKIDFGNGQTVLLKGVQPSSLGPGSFLTVPEGFTAREYLAANRPAFGADGPTSGTLPDDDITVWGGAGDDSIYGGARNDVLHGSAGSDTLVGDTTTDAPVGGNDVIFGDAGDDILRGGAGDDQLIGGSGFDLINGDAGNDLIQLEGDEALDKHAQAGAQLLGDATLTGSALVFAQVIGSGGSDRFVLKEDLSANASLGLLKNLIADFNVADTAERIDLTLIRAVRTFGELNFSTVTYNGEQYLRVWLGRPAVGTQYLTLKGVTATQLSAANFIFSDADALPAMSKVLVTGTGADDSLVGDAGGNTLDGGVGADTMEGRTGDDTYVVDNVGDVVKEVAGGGYDVVKSSVSHVLGDEVEDLTLTGTASIDGTGNANANRLIGNAGNNVLDGGAGTDVMRGGAGNDTYIVDDASDTIMELENEGMDSVKSSVSYTLAAGLENLTLTGTLDAGGTGNDLNNQLIGNAGNNHLFGWAGNDTLDGQLGSDVMVGGIGDDTYVVDSRYDSVIERANEGSDTVVSSVDYSIADKPDIENVALTGERAIVATGNAGNNRLLGNGADNLIDAGAGDDYLDGGSGADTMIGGSGNDSYIVDNVNDAVTELANGGTDTVNSSVKYTLADKGDVENLNLTGSGDVWGLGNNADNVITGNSGRNLLIGDGGADIIAGGAGDDILVGAGTGTNYESISKSFMDRMWLVLTGGYPGLLSDGTYGFAVNATGGPGKNTLYGGDGNDYLYAGNDGDTLNGDAGNDKLYGGIGQDNLYGQIGNDVIDGGSGDDRLFGGDGADQLNAGNGKDFLDGGAGDDVLIAYGLEGNDILLGGVGNDRLASDSGFLDGGDGDDTLTGGVANDVLVGGTGNDRLDGGYGNDIILLEGDDGYVNRSTRAAGVGARIGGAGADTFLMTPTGGGRKTLGLSGNADFFVSNMIYDFDVAVDKIDLSQISWLSDFSQLKFSVIDGGGWPSPTADTDMDYTQIEAELDGVRIVVSLYKVMPSSLTAENFIFKGAANATPPSFVPNGIDVANGVRWDAGNWRTVTAATASEGSDVIYGDDRQDETINGLAGDDQIYGQGGNDTLVGGDGNDVLDGGAGADVLRGGAGGDTYIVDSSSDSVVENVGEGIDTVQASLSYSLGANVENLTLTGVGALEGVGNSLNNTLVGNDGANVLDGGDGNDVLNGGSGADYLKGGAGADSLYGESSRFVYGMSGDDVLDGGAGNDLLDGGEGSNTYLFGKGDGQDIIRKALAWSSGTNTLQFKAGVTPSDIEVTQSGWSLVLSIAGTADKITVENFLYQNEIPSTQNPLQQIKFADGVVWDLQTIKEKMFAGTSGVDFITGTILADTIFGQAGNDSLNGLAGDDTLDGGLGNDDLNGGVGKNVYLFGKGDGQDTLNSYSDSAVGKLNTLKFKQGVAPSEIVVSQSDNHIILSIAGTQDKVTVRDFLYQGSTANAYNPLQMVVFADGTAWDLDAIRNKVFAGTANADKITGSTGADVISGQAGDDSLSGGDGDDLLDGGAGKDTLAGGAGNNTYLFGKGDGEDSLSSFLVNTTGMLNTLKFKEGVAPSEIVLKQFGSALIFSIAGTADKITVQDFMAGGSVTNSYNPIQQVQFFDGTIWNLDAIKSRLFAGTAGDDTISGTNGADAIYGQNGIDSLSGRDGDDLLDGGAGNDTIFGEAGNDTMNGGVGNDFLSGGVGDDIFDGGAGNDNQYGGTGNDTYIFSRGSGQDSVIEEDATLNNVDVAKFGADISADQLWFRRNQGSLEVSIIGSGDVLSIYNWFSGNGSHVEQFKTSDGKTLLDSQVQNLVDAMASFSPPAAGQTTLPANYQSSLNTVIAANWH